MCIFFAQDGSIVFRYRRYKVEEVAPFAPQPRARPNGPLNLVASGPKGPEQHRGNWGVGTGQFDFNARDDRLATSPLWKTMWLHPGQHVVVPMSHAFEATVRHGPRRWFAVKRRGDEPLWVPALGRIQKGHYRTEWHVSLVTVDAGPVFEPIHDTPREIVCLRDWDEVESWLAAEDEGKTRKLLRPSGSDLLESYRVHDDVFKPKFPAERCPEPYEETQAAGLGRFGAK